MEWDENEERNGTRSPRKKRKDINGACIRCQALMYSFVCSFACLSIYVSAFIEHLFCARLCAQHQECKDGPDTQSTQLLSSGGAGN